MTTIEDKPRALIVDDNTVNQRVTVGFMRNWGFETDVAGDGKAAIEAWEKGSYTIILMDLDMPIMDGFEATRNIRGREDNESRIPIVAITANVAPGTREKVIAAGMDDFISKPFKQEALRDCVENLTGCVSEEPSPKERTVSPPSTGEKQSPVLDKSVLQSFAQLQEEGTPSIVSELVGIYLDELDARLSTLKDAAERSDSEAIRKAAHLLKGSSSSIGAVGISEACDSLEVSATEGDLSRLNEQVEAILSLSEPTVIALRAVEKEG